MNYCFRDHETVPESIKRIACELLDEAIERTKPRRKNRDEAIHAVRVTTKKLRALLRLARVKSTDDIFAKEMARYRKIGRRLSDLRDATVMIATFDGLTKRYADKLSSNAFAELRKPFVRRRNKQHSDDHNALAEVARMLTSARPRVAKSPMEEDGFGAVHQGLKRSYKKGRLLMAEAQAAPRIETFHAWRKRVKDLWYQVRLFKPAWPAMLKKLADELEKLADYLSEDHDLAILRQRVLQQSPEDRSQLEALVALIDQRRGELEVEAKRLGKRLYVESPTIFVRRFKVYWRAWHREVKSHWEAAKMTTSTQEIERKWLVRELPKLTNLKHERIVQGYLAISSEGAEVRVRRRGDQCVETVKSQGGLTRDEIEIEISHGQFLALWPATEGRRLEKIRYTMNENGCQLELDVYQGSLAGLVIAEVEFESAEASQRFSPPSWFDKEVTENKHYRNSHLAL